MVLTCLRKTGESLFPSSNRGCGMPPENSNLKKPQSFAIKSSSFGVLMSRESEFRHKFGVFGAGAVSRSLIGGFVARSRDVGPVAAASFRVASRLANTLKGGYPVREPSALVTARAILFY